MPKFMFQCRDAGRKLVPMEVSPGKVSDSIIYYATFHKTVESPQTTWGTFTVETREPLHFKTGQNYTLEVTDLHGITVVRDQNVMKSLGKVGADA